MNLPLSPTSSEGRAAAQEKPHEVTSCAASEPFDAHAELALVRRCIRARRRQRRGSALNPYRWRLLNLMAAGATVNEMATALRLRTGREFHRTAIVRFIRRYTGRCGAKTD